MLPGRHANGRWTRKEEPHLRNEELPGILELDRPEEARRLRAAVLVNAELAAMSFSPEASDFYLDEAIALSAALGVGDAMPLQRAIHLVVAYRFYHQRRVTDALRVLRPAANRVTTDRELAFLHGRLEELSGWLNESVEDLGRAGVIYRRLLENPWKASLELRFARVLTLLGASEESVPAVERALDGTLDSHERVVAQIVLGDALRRSGRGEEALASYRRAVELDGRCQAGRVALAQALQFAGRLEEPKPLSTGILRSVVG